MNLDQRDLIVLEQIKCDNFSSSDGYAVLRCRRTCFRPEFIIWDMNDTFINYLQAQQKLISEAPYGAKVIQKFNLANSPFQRGVLHNNILAQSILTVKKTMDQLDSGVLLCYIQDLAGEP